MHIGILQCGHAPDPVVAIHGDYDALFHALFEDHGLTFTTWNVVDMEFPNGPDTAEGWLITGSRHGAYEDHLFIPPLEDFIRAVHATKAPMIGICFGHQIIAQALGGTVEKFDGGWAIGRRRYAFDGHGEVELNAWHQDQVVSLPPDARRLGTSDFCENAALVYGSHIMTLQPHPEIQNPVLETYLAEVGPDPRFPQDQVEDAKTHLGKPGHEAHFAEKLAHFLKDARS